MENTGNQDEKTPVQKDKEVVDSDFDLKAQHESDLLQESGKRGQESPSSIGRGGVNEGIRGRDSDQGKHNRDSPEKIRERRDAWNDPTRGDRNERK